MDLDLLSQGTNTPKAVAQDIKAICAVPVDDDGIRFDTAHITAEAIRADEEYAGARVIFTGKLGTARERLQIDVGYGDALWPASTEMTYPASLDFRRLSSWRTGGRQ